MWGQHTAVEDILGLRGGCEEVGAEDTVGEGEGGGNAGERRLRAGLSGSGRLCWLAPHAFYILPDLQLLSTLSPSKGMQRAYFPLN